jgi:hypothetical protein
MGTSASIRKQQVIQFLKLAVISGLVFIFSMLALLIILGISNQERIKTLFVATLNEHLKAEVMVGDIRLELLRGFPLASLAFNNVTILGSPNAGGGDTLLRADRVQVQFRLMDLLRKKYNVSQLTIHRGFARLETDREGVSNFDLWDASGKGEDTPSDFQLDLKRVILNNLHLQYTDRRSDLLIDLDVGRASLSGKFSQDIFSLGATGDMLAREIRVDGNSVLTDKAVSVDAAMRVEHQTAFHFEKGNISINKQGFGITGSIIRTDGGTEFDTRINGTRLSMQELLNDLPEIWEKYTDGYQAKGELGFTAVIQGTWSQEEKPFISAAFDVSRAELYHPVSKVRLRGLNFNGRYDNGPGHRLETANLEISNFQTAVSDGLIRGGVKINNLVKPYLELQIMADVDAGDMAKLLRLDTVERASGRVSMDVSFQGGMSSRNSFTGQDLIKARASGNISASNLSFVLKNNKLLYHGFSGSLQFRNNDLLIESFNGKVGGSDFTISGYFRNVLPYIFLEGETLHMVASLRANHIDFDELLQDDVSGQDTTYRLRFSDRLGFHLDAQVGYLKFRKFEARNVSGSASLQSKRFYAENLRFNSMNGQVLAAGFIDGTRPDRLVIGCDTHLGRVDVHQLFYQMGNFGQNGILAENIFGIITADFQFTSIWSPALEIDWGSLVTEAKIKVEDGVLVDFEPMVALSRFLRVDDLSRVTFSTLENQIRIRNNIVQIPDMEIKSSALNLQLSGAHSFENEIDYQLQILLSELLSRKNRERRNPQEQYGEIIDDGLGRTTLFLRVTGTLNDPQFRYDHQGVREKIRDDLRQEVRNLGDVFRREFNFLSRNPRDTVQTPLTGRQKEMQRLRKQEEGKVIIEWDDL